MGIFNQTRYLNLLYTIKDIVEHFPIEQFPITYEFGTSGADGWTGNVTYQTLILDKMRYNIANEPDFSQTTIIGYYPEGEYTGLVAPNLILPANMYTGPIIPDSFENVPVTVVAFEFTKGTEKFSKQILLIENWTIGVEIGDPRNHPDFSPVDGLPSTLLLTANKNTILVGDDIILTAESDIPEGEPLSTSARIKFYKNTGPSTNILLGSLPVVNRRASISVSPNLLPVGTSTFFATFAGSNRYGFVESNFLNIDSIVGFPLSVNLTLTPTSGTLGTSVLVSAIATATNTSSQYINNTTSFIITSQGPYAGENTNPLTLPGNFSSGTYLASFVVENDWFPTNINSSTYSITTATLNDNTFDFTADIDKNYETRLNWLSNRNTLISAGSTSTIFVASTSQNYITNRTPVSVDVSDYDLGPNQRSTYNSIPIVLSATNDSEQLHNYSANNVEFWATYTAASNVTPIVIPTTPIPLGSTSSGMAYMPNKLEPNKILIDAGYTTYRYVVTPPKNLIGTNFQFPNIANSGTFTVTNQVEVGKFALLLTLNRNWTVNPYSQLFQTTPITFKDNSNNTVLIANLSKPTEYGIGLNTGTITQPNRLYFEDTTGNLIVDSLPFRLDNQIQLGFVTTGSTFTLDGLVTGGNTATVYTVVGSQTYNKQKRLLVDYDPNDSRFPPNYAQVYAQNINVAAGYVEIDPPWLYNHPNAYDEINNKVITFTTPNNLESHRARKLSNLKYDIGLNVPYFDTPYEFKYVFLSAVESQGLTIGSVFKLAGGPQSPNDTSFVVKSFPAISGGGQGVWVEIDPPYTIKNNNLPTIWQRDNAIYNHFITYETNRNIAFFQDVTRSNGAQIVTTYGNNFIVLDNLPSNLQIGATFSIVANNISRTYTVQEIIAPSETIKITPNLLTTQGNLVGYRITNFTNPTIATTTTFLGTATAVNVNGTEYTWSLEKTLQAGKYFIQARINPPIELGSQAPTIYPQSRSGVIEVNSIPGLNAQLDVFLDQSNPSYDRVSLVSSGATSVDPTHFYIFANPARFFINDVLYGTSSWTRFGTTFTQIASFDFPKNVVNSNLIVRWAGSMNFSREYPDQYLFLPAELNLTFRVPTTINTNHSTSTISVNPLTVSSNVYVNSGTTVYNYIPQGTVNYSVTKGYFDSNNVFQIIGPTTSINTSTLNAGNITTNLDLSQFLDRLELSNNVRIDSSYSGDIFREASNTSTFVKLFPPFSSTSMIANNQFKTFQIDGFREANITQGDSFLVGGNILLAIETMSIPIDPDYLQSATISFTYENVVCDPGSIYNGSTVYESFRPGDKFNVSQFLYLPERSQIIYEIDWEKQYSVQELTNNSRAVRPTCANILCKVRLPNFGHEFRLNWYHRSRYQRITFVN